MGIHDEDIYNFDETGFRAGVGKDPWFITKDDKIARLYMEDPDNQEYITSVECVGGGGGYSTKHADLEWEISPRKIL